MAENSAEDFVDDFLNASEFLTKNIIFSNFFIYPMPSAVSVFLLYMGIITLNENLSHVPTNNYLIRAYDVDIYNKTSKTLLKNGDGDVCI